jgi:hypothetical protein
MSLIKLFLAGNTSALVGFFPDQERKIPGNPEIPEIFPHRNVLSVASQDSQLVTGITPKHFEQCMLLRLK